MNKEASLLIILMLLHPLLSRLRILASFPEFFRCMAAGVDAKITHAQSLEYI